MSCSRPVDVPTAWQGVELGGHLPSSDTPENSHGYVEFTTCLSWISWSS